MNSRISLVCIILFCISLLYGQDSVNYPIYFEYNQYELDTAEEKLIGFFLRNFNDRNIDSILINAYCDDRGSEKYNTTLSERRAMSIALNFQKHLPKFKNIEYFGKGALPLELNEDIEEQRAKNRRGDVVLYYSKTKNSKSLSTLKMAQKSPEFPEMKSFIDRGKSGDKLELNVFFNPGSHKLKIYSYETLDSLVAVLGNSNRKISIEGHIFSDGLPPDKDGLDYDTKTYNLSENRAKVVYLYLINKGIDKERLSFQGLAGKFPTGISPERDRRVEIVLKD